MNPSDPATHTARRPPAGWRSSLAAPPAAWRRQLRGPDETDRFGQLEQGGLGQGVQHGQRGLEVGLAAGQVSGRVVEARQALSGTVLAGGGIKGGVVPGFSDRYAAYPASNPTTPADLAATIYHCLGVDPRLEVHDRLGRPRALCEGTPIAAVLR